MLSPTLTSHFGKIFANIVRELIRCDGIISRDTHITAGYIKSCANDNGEASPSLAAVASLANGCNLAERMERRLSDGKFKTSQPPSSFKLAKVWTPYALKILNRQFEPERIMTNDLIKGQKRFLNATNLGDITATATTNTKSFIRTMCMLARPIQLPKSLVIDSIKEPIAMNIITKRWFKPKPNNRLNCAEWCGEDKCNLNRKASRLKKSMWLTPQCHPKCRKHPQKPYRYDVEHMPGSNKATREYQQTWIECPPIRIVKKPVCCFEPKCLPPICRRPRQCRQPVPEKHKTCKVNTCTIEPECVKVRMPCCCVKARETPCCKIYPTPSCCQKRCTPYPSFSECCKPDANRKRPVECLCLARPTMCEVWADWRRKYLPGGYEDS